MNQNSYAIINGRVIDYANNFDQNADIFVKNGEISEIGKCNRDEGWEVLDAAGCWVVPGLIDLHVHFREPGQEHKEDMASGAKSAAAGGFTTVCAMPNTQPAIDSAFLANYTKKCSVEIGILDILPVGAVTIGLEGKELAPIKEMAAAGAVAISDDGFAVKNAALQLQAMKIAASLDLPVFVHCEDLDLTGNPAAEDVMIARDIALARAAGARLHICHISTAFGVQLVREAKARGDAVTAEAAPHHITLWREAANLSDPNFKMNPPLRTKADVQAVLEGLRDGTIDAIATDHAPHACHEKAVSYEKAPNGVVGLETAVPVAISELVHTGLVTPIELVGLMSAKPAKILGLGGGCLSIGAKANVAIIDPNALHTIDSSAFASKGRNTPFNGRQMRGRVLYTMYNGRIVFKYSKPEVLNDY